MNLTTIPATTSGFYIGEHFIRQDDQGRYCLNDLHKAAGSKSRDQPSKWLILNTTKELIAEINAENLVTVQNQLVAKVQGGNGWQGTFVDRKLLIAYAMWISPEFHLCVINTFDAYVTGQLQPVSQQGYSDALRCLLDKLEQEGQQMICG